MKIEVFGIGIGCVTCILLMKNVREAVAETGVNADVVMINDMARINESGIPDIPGLKIDGIIKSAGRVPTKDEITRWITGNV